MRCCGRSRRKRWSFAADLSVSRDKRRAEHHISAKQVDSVLCPTIDMATDRGTPARSNVRTADRRMSCTRAPRQPAARRSSQRYSQQSP